MTNAALPLTDAQLCAAPFHLDAGGLDWVRTRFAALDTDAKIAQLVLPMCRDLSDAGIEAVARFRTGGVHRFPSYSEAELRRSAMLLMQQSAIPPLLTADIEMSEKASIKAGTAFPNQMAVAATGDRQNAHHMGAIAAREAGYLGFGVSWTPVADLALNFRSNVVNTRAFSDNVDNTIGMVSAYLDGMHSNGLVACIKHFPGDGLDERDQHYVTTHNTMDMDEWRASFGRIYAEAIRKDVRLVMVGHVTLAAYGRNLGGAARSGAHLPASLNGDILHGLLRGDLNYNGVIVSDATGMAGFTSCGARKDIVPMCIENGCDILLFPRDIEEDIGFLWAGLESGALSQSRLDAAVLRILALKASMGLHLGHPVLPDEKQRASLLGSEQHRNWARDVAEGCVTLVRDTQNLLPILPARHRRILLAELRDRRSPSAALPDLEIPAMLEALGFIITRVVPGEVIAPDDHDIGLYLMAEEGLSGKEVLGPRWEQLHGPFPLTMQRMWQHLPTLYVSLGSPFLTFHVPDCPTFVNAYSAVMPVQQAVVDALTGKIAFKGRSPVDTNCGLPVFH
ncbi:glycoside hydrolase family 3 protein [Roseinatronobacter alkalisoli]|uniref:beta-N-acetylhexosaminidase n=1 Tax=Roseinatronobacter alkalisoli TaxID=3028235 RepID=A0ABT5TDE4_9RHOB|nr:glycoside hydrolase family 3 N-terminal domain-containing protein [Roseinatronobacter sp. HJB301]MDD7973135.1 glycoside hydrolase family 3 N-terminal domain-containing protein [Roseinatronobacter sp. HJB301]